MPPGRAPNPEIFGDTERQIKFVKSDKDLTIRPYKIDNFISYLETYQTLYNSDI